MRNKIDFRALEEVWIEDSKEDGMTQQNLRSMVGFFTKENQIHYFPTEMLMSLQEELEYLDLDSGFYDVEYDEKKELRMETFWITLAKRDKTFEVSTHLSCSKEACHLSLTFNYFTNVDVGKGSYSVSGMSEEERKDIETAILRSCSFFEEHGYSRLDLAVNNCTYSLGAFQYLLEKG